MSSSNEKTFSFVSTLALVVIAVQLIPFSYDKELTNHCRDYYALTKGKTLPIAEESMTARLKNKVIVISKKTGLQKKQVIHNYCHSFYLNQ